MNLESHTREVLMFLENLALSEMTDMSTKEARILVDGSQWSPAERAIPGVEKVWKEAEGDAYTRWWIFFDTVNHWISGWMNNGFYLGWEEGILRIYGPDYVA